MAPPVVLIVESSAELRRMLEDTLQQRGYAVTSATDADEAREMLLHRPAGKQD